MYRFNQYSLVLGLAMLAAAPVVCAQPPACSDPNVLKSLVAQTRSSEGELVEWAPSQVLTLDWDEQTAELVGMRPEAITALRSCAAQMVPSKDKVWIDGEPLDPRIQKNIEMSQRTADQMCAPNRRGNAASSVICQRLQDSARKQREDNATIEKGQWRHLESRGIRYATGLTDDGVAFARILLW